MTRPRCFDILDLDPGVSFEELKTAYRDMVNVWHPDRYAHNPRLQKKAERKLQELNAAYEEARRFIHPAGKPASGDKVPSAGPSSPRGRAPASPGPDCPEPRAPSSAGRCGPEAWQATEARLKTLYLNKARREYRQQGRWQRPPAGPVKSAQDTPRRRRIGEVVPGRCAPKTELPPAGDDPKRHWLTTEQRLKELAKAQAVARRRAQEIENRKRLHEAAVRHAARRARFVHRVSRAAAGLIILAAGGSLLWTYRAALEQWVRAILR